jgi:hypothetical protein
MRNFPGSGPHENGAATASRLTATLGEWMLINAFVMRTGYTEKAVRRKIDSGVWVEGIHFRRAPDGHITMNMLEYYRWVEGKASS